MKRPFVKVQTTGPLSVGLSIVDEKKRAIYYNAEFVDVVVKALAMKCRWQIRKFQPFAEKVICFVDEPILSAFGSSTYVSVTRDDTVAKLGEVIETVHAEGALAGVHCCGNTEWSILIDAGVDIVNFDAFDYGDTILLYPEAMKALPESWQGAGVRNRSHQQRQDPCRDGRLAGRQVLRPGGEAGQGDRTWIPNSSAGRRSSPHRAAPDRCRWPMPNWFSRRSTKPA